MPCFHPLTGWRVRTGRLPNGKWPITFSAKDGFLDLPVTVPCGRCLGCRLERSRQWALRCVHEAMLHDANSFITLTYAPEYLPPFGSLDPEALRNFWKRLRYYLGGDKVRYYACGEYGSRLSRPHYHAICFGCGFPDKELFKVRRGVRYYVSPLLQRAWPFGFSLIGEVTFESAAYVARYCLKKMTGDRVEEYYGNRLPEFSTMSRKPGIAHDWIEKYWADVYPHDYCIVRNGTKCRPPRYYDNVFEMIDEEEYQQVIAARRRRAALAQADPDNSPRRMAVKEAIQENRASKLIRPLEAVTLDEVLS